MRKLLAACVCAMALAAPSGGAAQQQEGWTYAYIEGVATATERDDHGRVTATLTCRPPEGNIVITDFTFGGSARRARTAAVRIGNMSVNVPMERGDRRAITINLPQRPPILAGVQPTDNLSVTINNETRTYHDGSATRMKEVAYACWGS